MIACYDMAAGDGAGTGAKGTRRRPQPDQTAAGAGGARPRGRSVGPVRVEDASAARFALGAPCVVPPEAPAAQDHGAGCTDEEIAVLFARKTERREQAIQRIMEAAQSKGTPIERFVAAIQYDGELAPKTTNRRQLLELGIEVPTADAMPKSDAEVRHALWTIVYGLARLGIFLTGTDRLDDRALLLKLCTRILEDPVADIPPSADMSEFIDCEGTQLTQCSDGLSGPFDFGPQDDDDEFGHDSRSTGTSRHPGVRDHLLPRPDRR